MRSWIRPGAMILALAAGVTLAASHESATSETFIDAAAPAAAGDDDATGSLGTVGVGHHQVGHHEVLPLSDEQRGWIFMGVINLPGVPDAPVTAHEAAADVPESVELRELPPIVTRRIPLVGGYKFVKLEDRILLVDPADRAVVAQIPRYKLVN